MIHNGDRRGDKFHFDFTINITTILAVCGLIATMAHYGNAAVNYLKSIDAKTNIMWSHFDKGQLSKDELTTLIEISSK